MSVKQQFLDKIRNNLQAYPRGEVDDYVEYYDELISERIANGEQTAAVLHTIGTPKAIAADFKHDVAVSRAVKKPTVSNGLKALIAVLGVLSLPLLIPVAAVVIALGAASASIFVGLLVALVGAAAGAVVGVVSMASVVFSGDAPVYLLFLAVGAALVVVFGAFELARRLFMGGGWLLRSLIRKLNVRHHTKQWHTVSQKEQ